MKVGFVYSKECKTCYYFVNNKMVNGNRIDKYCLKLKSKVFKMKNCKYYIESRNK